MKAGRSFEWKEVPFTGTLVRNSVGRENQILSSEIRPDGRFPVVDQGQAFIAGYCDDEKRVIRDDLPLVIFGDHTRCFKYVDFPFILGADGTKVLKPDAKQFEPRFFYYALLNLEIPSRGYRGGLPRNAGLLGIESLADETIFCRPDRAGLSRTACARIGFQDEET
jgi:hypothetical protein